VKKKKRTGQKEGGGFSFSLWEAKKGPTLFFGEKENKNFQKKDKVPGKGKGGVKTPFFRGPKKKKKKKRGEHT